MIPSARQIDDLIEVVRKTGAELIMPRFRSLAADDIETKSGPKDLVTIADRAAELAIGDGIARILPEAAIVGEEAVSASPHLLDAIGSSETCVIVDPIDGTGNYVSGLAVFGTILAVVHRGETIFGLLYDPVMDDWMFALRGEGAWFRRQDGTRLPVHTRTTEAVSSASGFVTLDDYDDETREIVRRGFGAAFQIRDIRCSCHEYRAVASGNVDFLRSYGLKPWDHAAGNLLLEEAGGWARVDGEMPYTPDMRQGRLIAAGTEILGHRIAELAAPLP
ncbi:inositol monophosphatase family protein [Ovoidimarina sediminis]|uniref:inositol monophosphatase family protein n=1 Tax=Ovoidimarina sediminis TaxID=3079856 RepID=UPI002909CABC|nr:inositol monophosphatase [Rhodophyticola sp. MJ-SS7]MDU8944159.1 inositol monophosphatase [Rhodophyticola sp. MJ-SS7]